MNNAAGYTLGARARTLGKDKSKLRIADLRRHFGKLINTTDNKEEDVLNPFQDGQAYAQKTPGTAMSLSVYNKPAALARPRTAKDSLSHLQGIVGLEPVEADENGVPLPQNEVESRIADMDVPKGLKMLARTGTEQYQLQDIQEITQIKDKLAKDGCHNMTSAFYEPTPGPNSMIA